MKKNSFAQEPNTVTSERQENASPQVSCTVITSKNIFIEPSIQNHVAIVESQSVQCLFNQSSVPRKTHGFERVYDAISPQSSTNNIVSTQPCTISSLLPGVCHSYLGDFCKDNDCKLNHFLPQNTIFRNQLKKLGILFATTYYDTYVLRCCRLFDKFFVDFCDIFSLKKEKLITMISDCFKRKMYQKMWYVVEVMFKPNESFVRIVKKIISISQAYDVDDNFYKVILEMILDTRCDPLQFEIELERIAIKFNYNFTSEIIQKLKMVCEANPYNDKLNEIALKAQEE